MMDNCSDATAVLTQPVARSLAAVWVAGKQSCKEGRSLCVASGHDSQRVALSNSAVLAVLEFISLNPKP